MSDVGYLPPLGLLLRGPRAGSFADPGGAGASLEPWPSPRACLVLRGLTGDLGPFVGLGPPVRPGHRGWFSFALHAILDFTNFDFAFDYLNCFQTFQTSGFLPSWALAQERDFLLRGLSSRIPASLVFNCCLFPFPFSFLLGSSLRLRALSLCGRPPLAGIEAPARAGQTFCQPFSHCRTRLLCPSLVKAGRI